MRDMAKWLNAERMASGLLPAKPRAEAIGREIYMLGWETGRAIGLAQGELKGRQELADELAAAYSIDGADKELKREDVERIKARQLH